MKLHQSKTKYSIISSCQKLGNSLSQSLNLTFDGEPITQVKSERVLGVYIDNHLTWSTHIEKLHQKLLKRIAVLARVRKYVPKHYRLMLYNASIKPLFEYCCSVWSNCSQGNIDDLFKLQKRCARLILDSHSTSRSFENFQELKWLPIDQVFVIKKRCLLGKIINGQAPEYLTTKLATFRFQHQYILRTKIEYRLPKPKTNALKRTFFYSTLKNWNTRVKRRIVHLK
jgi:hypothetical protein